MVSSDARAQPIMASWSQEFGPRRLYEITGHTPHPMFTIFKLLWLRENRPDVWSQAHKFYCFEELIQARLGLQPAVSWPLAGRTMMFNVTTHQWEDDILSAIGLEAARLAPPVPSGTVVGTIGPGVADQLGLPKDVPVVAGEHDQPCGALGAGVVEPGLAMYATGTVECICPAFDRLILEEKLFKSNICTYDHTIDGMYTTVLFSELAASAAAIAKWPILATPLFPVFRSAAANAHAGGKKRNGRMPDPRSMWGAPSARIVGKSMTTSQMRHTP